MTKVDHVRMNKWLMTREIVGVENKIDVLNPKENTVIIWFKGGKKLVINGQSVDYGGASGVSVDFKRICLSCGGRGCHGGPDILESYECPDCEGSGEVDA